MLKKLQNVETVDELIAVLEPFRGKQVLCCGSGNCVVYRDEKHIIIDDNSILEDALILSSYEDIVKHVMTEYESHSDELSGAFFDFYCKNVSGNDLLRAYHDIQDDINGDVVCRVTDLVVDEDNLVSGGTIIPLYEDELDGMVPEHITAEEWLRSLDGKNIYRLMDLETTIDDDTKIVSATLLDFVW